MSDMTKVRTGLPTAEFLTLKEKQKLNLMVKKSLVYLRKRSLVVSLKLLGVDRIIWTRDEMIQTAAIVKFGARYNPDIYINLNFIDEIKAKCEEKNANFEKALASLLAHELMHYLLRHLTPQQNKRLKQPHLANLVFDIFINHLLHQFDLTELMKVYYPSKQFVELSPDEIGEDGETVKDCFPIFFLNPHATDFDKKFKSAWDSISKVQWSLEDIEAFLLEHLPKNESPNANFLGNHSSSTQGDDSASGGFPGEDVQFEGEDELSGAAKEEAEDAAREIFLKGKPTENFSVGASKFGTLFEEHIKTEKKKSKDVDEMVLRALIRDVKGQAYRALGIFESEKQKQSVLPSFHDKKDLVLLGMGHDPIFYSQPVLVNRGKAVIYTDVSGSMNGIKDILYALLLGLEEEYDINIWLFSTILHELTKEELRDGIVHTTGGTDFDIWIDHLRENQLEKVIVVTDGYCGINQSNQRWLEENTPELFVIYTKGHSTEALEKHTLGSCVLDVGDF